MQQLTLEDSSRFNRQESSGSLVCLFWYAFLLCMIEIFSLIGGKLCFETCLANVRSSLVKRVSANMKKYSYILKEGRGKSSLSP